MVVNCAITPSHTHETVLVNLDNIQVKGNIIKINSVLFYINFFKYCNRFMFLNFAQHRHVLQCVESPARLYLMLCVV